MRDELELDSLPQVRALAHPIRLRILTLLGRQQLTNKQIAERLALSPPRVHFHLRELASAGLVHLVEERPKGGVVEKYYRAVASGFRLAPGLGGAAALQPELADAVFAAASKDLAAAVAHFRELAAGIRVVQTSAPLSPDRLVRVTSHFDAINEEFAAANDEPRAADDAVTPEIQLTYVMHPLPPTEVDGGANSEQT